MKKTISGIMLTLLLIAMLTLAFNIQPAKASGTIYISSDYTFTSNIYEPIVVTADNIIIDGAGYTVQGSGSGTGIDLSYRNNVTLKNVEVTKFEYGIYLFPSSSNNILVGNKVSNNSICGIFVVQGSNNNTISGNNVSNNNVGIVLGNPSSYNVLSGNNVSNNGKGIWIYASCNYNILSNNTVSNNNGYGIYLQEDNVNNILSGNNITNNNGDGVRLYGSSNNIVKENTIANNDETGIVVWASPDNTISRNNITNNLGWGISLGYDNSKFYHNNLVDNTGQVSIEHGSINVWDNGYPSGGNYWSDYTDVDLYSGPYQNETGSDGICDTPYTIDANNKDNYPLISRWSPVAIQNTTISKGGTAYPIQVISNATILDFDETPGSLKLTVSGATGTSGYVRVIQPIGLNSTEIKVFLNHTRLVPPPYPSISTNDTHYFIYFAFTFASIYNISIEFPIVGDVNCDGIVSIQDVAIAALAFGSYPGHPNWNPIADLNNDGIINIIDLVIIGIHFGETW